MKRTLSRTLILSMILMLLPPQALAARDDVIARKDFDGFSDQISAFCAVENVLWMYSSSSVYAYDTSDDTLSAYPWTPARTSAQNGLIRDENGLRCYSAITAFFAHEDAVYVLLDKWHVGSSDAQRYREDIVLGRLVIQNGLADIEELNAIDWKNLLASEDDSLDFSGAFVQNGVLCGLSQSMGADIVYLAPLDGSRARTLSLTGGSWISSAIAWRDGFMLFRQDGRTAQYALMGLEDDQPGDWCELPMSAERYLSLSGMVQYGDELLYISGSMLTAFTPEDGAVREVVSIPVSTSNAHGLITPSGVYAAGGYDGIVLRLINRESTAAGTLVIDDTDNAGNMDNALLAFQDAYPNIEVSMLNTEDILTALLTRSSESDVIVLPARYDNGELSALLDRSWALPIESGTLRDAVLQMYPGISDQLIKDGQLLGVPFNASATGPTLCTGAMRALGLNIEDVPTSWPDFLSWLGSLIPTADVPLIDGDDDAGQIRERLIRGVLTSYEAELQAGTLTGYDTPELRAALKAIDKLDIDALIEQFYNTLGNADCNPLFDPFQTIGINDSTYLDDYDDIPLYLSLSAELPRRVSLKCSVAIINPFSQHTEEAVRFIEELAAQDELTSRAMLTPTLNDAVRSADYARYTSEQDALIAQYERDLEAAEDDAKAAIEADLDRARQTRASMENWYYIVSAESLNRYRDCVQSVLLRLNDSLFPTAAMNNPYTCGEGSLDDFIAELQHSSEMRRLEQ